MFQNVWKKFRRGQRYDSLRDLIPAVTRRLLTGKSAGQLNSKEFWVLSDVSFQLERGESIGVIGPNGSGKSTILKLLSNILKPDRGSVRVNGRAASLIELGAGFHPDLTGRENIYLNGTILGMKRPEINQRFDSIVDFSELHQFLDTPVKRYSSGMYARLGFAVAAHVEPEVLIVDEVLSVGDYHFQEKCFTKMKEFTKNGTTLVFVSHNLAAVSSLCQTALLLKWGEPVYQGDVRTAVAKYCAFYQEDVISEEIEVLSASLTSVDGESREVFDPGEKAILTVTMRARKDVANGHAALLIHTTDGQLIFDTPTSWHTDKTVTLKQGETATATFRIDLNLQNGVFLLGLTVRDPFIDWNWYSNLKIKQVVMTGNRKSNGAVFLNPSAELITPSAEYSHLAKIGATGL
jgi:lipopolysaccharide transport system ATP-binding protein